MPVLSDGQLVQVEVADAETKSLIGRYWSAGIGRFLATGDTGTLDRYRGIAIRGYPLETDPDAIEDFYLGTDFDFQELYEP
jgi:hypothetical protein